MERSKENLKDLKPTGGETVEQRRAIDQQRRSLATLLDKHNPNKPA
jgi:hypothetical protein